jgi:hypothetical protein
MKCITIELDHRLILYDYLIQINDRESIAWSDFVYNYKSIKIRKTWSKFRLSSNTTHSSVLWHAIRRVTNAKSLKCEMNYLIFVPSIELLHVLKFFFREMKHRYSKSNYVRPVENQWTMIIEQITLQKQKKYEWNKSARLGTIDEVPPNSMELTKPLNSSEDVPLHISIFH